MERWLERFARANFVRSADTAHDLKTPLNIAVLNLELLRMRLRKVTGADDDKVAAYTQAIELELRRMARIFDTFFLLCTPPKDEEPGRVDVASICAEVAGAAGFAVEGGRPALMRAHEARIRQAFSLFFEGVTRILKPESRRLTVERDGSFTAAVEGIPDAADFEVTRIFKFYYTDALGNPDLALASARLIVETYGGELNAVMESDKVWLRLSVPLGDQ